METTKLIHDFIDGEMSGAEEEQFFVKLSQNDEMQLELKEQLAIKSAIKADTAAFTPATASTMKIFSAVGFTAPAAATVATTSAASGFLAGIATTFTNYSQLIIGGLISAAITTAVVLNFVVADKNELAQNNPATQNTAAQVIAQNSNIPSVSSGNAIENKAEPQVIEKIVYKNVYITVPDTSQSNVNLAGNSATLDDSVSNLMNSDNLNQEATINFSNLAVFNTNIPSYSEDMRNIPNSNIDLPIIDINKKDNVWSLEISGSENWYTQSSKDGSNNFISPSKEALFNNTSISLLMKISKDFQAGVEVRNENFFQQYEGKNQQGDQVIYEQQPNFTSYSVLLRYSARSLAIMDNLYPIAQVSTGGNLAGIILRGSGGLYYSPYPGISFLLTAGYNNLTYRHGSNDISSNKISVSYGVNFEF
jgi:hypothetical protein